MPNPPTITTSKRGLAVIQDPLLNKGTAFTSEERKLLELNGLLPPRSSTPEEQVERAYAAIAAKHEPLDRYVALLDLQNRNEHLFYQLLERYMAEFMPIVYTPTVGLACQNFSHVFQRARGLWITPDMRGHMEDVLRNATADRSIELIVVTDNESILGIGDQGAGGMAISVGKLALYVAGGGINPGATLPVSLDVGTNNDLLINDPLYLGWRSKRLKGTAYEEFVDEFVDAVRAVCADCLVQWEDFRKDNALSILQKHRHSLLSFNDDIQGTGAVALAGIFSALRITRSEITDHRFLIHGAGAAGMGIAAQIKSALESAGVDHAAFDHHIAVLDSRGLLVADQEYSDGYKNDLAWPVEHAQAIGLGNTDERQLADVLNAFKPTVLIGTSGQPGAFNEGLIRTMAGYCDRPVIMPFSNPTHRSEAIPDDLIEWTEGRALVATGSPFDPVEYNGQTYRIGQGNNVFIFPGLGLGSLIAHCSEVTDEMVTAASQACAASVSEEELAVGMLYPAIERLREVSTSVAHQVAATAIDQGLTNSTHEQIEQRLANDLWDPQYPTFVSA